MRVEVGFVLHGLLAVCADNAGETGAPEAPVLAPKPGDEERHGRGVCSARFDAEHRCHRYKLVGVVHEVDRRAGPPQCFGDLPERVFEIDRAQDIGVDGPVVAGDDGDEGVGEDGDAELACDEIVREFFQEPG